jgi:formylglycine-generating enzyme required for sulfatase activity
MVVIPAGTFQMGKIQGVGYSDEQPVHWVSIASFAMARYEITNAEYVHFLNSVKRRGPEGEPWFSTKAEDSDSHIIGTPGNFGVETGYENHPLIEVSCLMMKKLRKRITHDYALENLFPSYQNLFLQCYSI